MSAPRVVKTAAFGEYTIFLGDYECKSLTFRTRHAAEQYIASTVFS